MGYALFAQRKVCLTGQLNSVSLQQTQRSNEQYLLATQTLSLQQQLSSMQAAQSLELSDLYELLSHATADGGLDQTYVNEIKNNKDSNGKTQYENLTKDAQELVDKHETANRDAINAKIKEVESGFEAELDEINREIYLVSIKENAVEMEVKRLDTQVSSLQKQLEAVEEAESSAIDRATPKFNGVG